MPIADMDPYRGTVTFAQLQAEALGDDFDSDKYGDRVKRWTNEALQRFARRSGLPEYEYVLATATDPGENTLLLPQDDVRILSVRTTDDRRDLTAVDIQKIDEAS
jgi:hypothetical protein